jgi:hypothetical protein
MCLLSPMFSSSGTDNASDIRRSAGFSSGLRLDGGRKNMSCYRPAIGFKLLLVTSLALLLGLLPSFLFSKPASGIDLPRRD